MFHYQTALFHNQIVISHNQTGLLDYQPGQFHNAIQAFFIAVAQQHFSHHSFSNRFFILKQSNFAPLQITINILQ